MDANFYENMMYLLLGIVLSGVCAAIAQIISIKMLTSSQTKIQVCVKKADENGHGKP